MFGKFSMPFFTSIVLAAHGDGYRVTFHRGKRSIPILETGVLAAFGKKINDKLRVFLRKRVGKESQPSAGILDSQSVKTTSTGGSRGYDGGKKINGRKRHILVDTLGLLLAVVVHAANIQDRDGAELVLQRIKGFFSRLKVIWADGAYQGQFTFIAKRIFKRKVKVVTKLRDQVGFCPLPQRWIIERTFAWLVGYRRHSRDYERLEENSEAMIYVSMIQVMLKRI
jgi:putative transposase